MVRNNSLLLKQSRLVFPMAAQAKARTDPGFSSVEGTLLLRTAFLVVGYALAGA